MRLRSRPSSCAGSGRASQFLVERALGHVHQADADGLAGTVVDDDLAVAVDDVAARRDDLDRAQTVVVGLGDELLAAQDLQEPQAEEDDRRTCTAAMPTMTATRRATDGSWMTGLSRRPVRIGRSRRAGSRPSSGTQITCPSQPPAHQQVERRGQQGVEDERRDEHPPEEEAQRHLAGEEELGDGEAARSRPGSRRTR